MTWKLLSIAALLVLFLSSVTVWNKSNSAAPVGMYRISNARLERGRLVLLRNPLKMVVGLPGDVVTFSPKGIYVNGSLLDNSAIPKGSPYQPYPYGTYKLEEGQYLFMGRKALSFDGRYEGPQPDSLIMHVVSPVITK